MIRVCLGLAIVLALFPAAGFGAQSAGHRKVLSELAAQDWVDDDDTLSFGGSPRAIRSSQCHGIGLRYSFGTAGSVVIPGYEDFRCDVTLIFEGGGFDRRSTVWVHLLQKQAGIPHFHFSFQPVEPSVGNRTTSGRAGYSYCRELGRSRIGGLYSFPASWAEKRVADGVAKAAVQQLDLREPFARGCQKGLAAKR